MLVRRIRWTWILVAVPVSFAAIGIGLIACSGSPGPAGPSGAAGAAGNAGTNGANGSDGPAGSAGAPGAPGAAGPPNTTFIRLALDDAGADFTTPIMIDAGSWGPFNLSGVCYTDLSGDTCARFMVNTKDPPPANYTDYETGCNPCAFPPDAGYTVLEDVACGTPDAPDFEGPYDGTFGAVSLDGKTYITGGLSTGAYVGGRFADGGVAGRACTFGGYITQSP